MSTPELYLRTGYVLDARGRIVETREPGAARATCFTIVAGRGSIAWAVRADVPDEVSAEIAELVRDERFDGHEPRHAERYLALVAAHVAEPLQTSGGPSFEFPAAIPDLGDVVLVDDERALAQHFHGWVPGEIAEGRAPVCAVVADGHPVSICFCARRSDEAAEAGVDTAEPYRGRGHAARVTAAWARAMRASGRVPLYSTSWTNDASLAVARKVGLLQLASYWNIADR